MTKNNNKDLTLSVDDFYLNIRVAIIAKTKNGFILEKKKTSEYYFLIGGRIKIYESSLEAAKREFQEEIGLEIKEEDLEFKTLIENFFTYEVENIKTHELCFLYEIKNELENIKLEENFIECKLEEIKNIEIKPKILQDLLLKETLPNHVITKN